MEALRQSLDINKFVLFGGSWGSTLALAYSIAYPEHVSGLILRGIFLGTRPEVDWFLNGMGRFFLKPTTDLSATLIQVNGSIC